MLQTIKNIFTPQKDLISVIVPVYKVEPYLARCIESIQNQTYANLEIILVDDGSPDNCGAICDAYAQRDSRIRVIHQPNGGLSAARNSGIDAATGDYLVFFDSDDWMDPTMLSVLHNTAKRYHADIAECSFRCIYKDYIAEETTCSGAVRVAVPVQSLKYMLDYKYFWPIACNKLYARHCIGDIRYPIGRLHEDEFTTWKFHLRASKLVSVDISLFNYDRSREGSITATYKAKNLDAVYAMGERMEYIWGDASLSELETQMNNVFSWAFFENLMKAANAKVDGTDAAKFGLRLYEQLKNRQTPLESRYKECYEILQKKGVTACASAWSRLR